VTAIDLHCDSYGSSFNNVILLQLIKRIEKPFICNGMLHAEAFDLLFFQKHCIPRMYDLLEVSDSAIHQTVIYRSLG